MHPGGETKHTTSPAFLCPMPKTILITGATSGFGEAMARRTAEGHRVIITGRRKERLDTLRQEQVEIRVTLELTHPQAMRTPTLFLLIGVLGLMTSCRHEAPVGPSMKAMDENITFLKKHGLC